MERSNTRSSERYVPDNRFNDDNNTISGTDKQDFDKTLDSCDGSEKSIEPKAKVFHTNFHPHSGNLLSDVFIVNTTLAETDEQMKI